MTAVIGLADPVRARQRATNTPTSAPTSWAFVAEAASGQPLDRFLEREVFSKLGMTDTRFRLNATDAARSAPTEIAPPRGYPLRGEVHDENAWALGGVAGHAGLFSTAADLSVFAQMLLDGGKYQGTRIIADSTVALFTRRAAGHRALGWDTCDGGAGCGQLHVVSAPLATPASRARRSGSIPTGRVFVILLTNRVHAARARASQQGHRRRAERPGRCRRARGDGRPHRGAWRCRSASGPTERHRLEPSPARHSTRAAAPPLSRRAAAAKRASAAKRQVRTRWLQEVDRQEARPAPTSTVEEPSAKSAATKSKASKSSAKPTSASSAEKEDSTRCQFVLEESRKRKVPRRKQEGVTRTGTPATSLLRYLFSSWKSRRWIQDAATDVAAPVVEDAQGTESLDGSVSADQARLVLRRVKDPELNLNIVDLGLIYDIHVTGADVRIDMSLTSPGCPSGPEIMGEAEQQLRSIPGIGNVEMNLIWSPPWTPERIEPRVRAYMGF